MGKSCQYYKTRDKHTRPLNNNLTAKNKNGTINGQMNAEN